MHEIYLCKCLCLSRLFLTLYLILINAVYHDKLLIFIGGMFWAKLVSHHGAVNEVDSCRLLRHAGLKAMAQTWNTLLEQTYKPRKTNALTKWFINNFWCIFWQSLDQEHDHFPQFMFIWVQERLVTNFTRIPKILKKHNKYNIKFYAKCVPILKLYDEQISI